MLGLLKNNRCPRCHNNRAIRKCPRNNRDICWDCCNLIRIDLRCPAVCPYKPVSDPEHPSPFPAFKADSHLESIQACKQYIDLWINKLNPELNDHTPSQYAIDNKQELLAWLTKFQYPAYFPLDYLLQKLGISEVKSENPPDPELTVKEYYDHIIALEWDKLIYQTINDRALNGTDDRYAEIISAIPQLRKMTSFDIIHAGVTEDGGSAFVFGEINHKENWTFLLTNANKRWALRQNINGSPQAYYRQNEIFTGIADALSKADDSTTWTLISAALRTYPDCADLYYYRGLYWQLVKQYDKAKVDFFSSIALDNYLEVSYVHLANLNLVDKNYQEGLYWNEELSYLRPDDPAIRSNVAACYASMGDLEKAREIWEKIVREHPEFQVARQNLERLKQ
ncbi:MAG TPA: hypothetical protein PKI15_06905 [Candidatus Cloacimonadota bacterium]|nr:hypothetical protein [Candidatus Cloacimonadota bacterium]